MKGEFEQGAKWWFFRKCVWEIYKVRIMCVSRLGACSNLVFLKIKGWTLKKKISERFVAWISVELFWGLSTKDVTKYAWNIQEKNLWKIIQN